MAIFLFVAWTIELAEKIGLLDDGSDNPTVRAYHQAMVAVDAVKRELAGREILAVEPARVRYRGGDGVEGSVAFLSPHLVREPTEVLADLGPQGRFAASLAGGELHVDLTAHYPDGMPFPSHVRMPVA